MTDEIRLGAKSLLYPLLSFKCTLYFLRLQREALDVVKISMPLSYQVGDEIGSRN